MLMHCVLYYVEQEMTGSDDARVGIDLLPKLH